MRVSRHHLFTITYYFLLSKNPERLRIQDFLEASPRFELGNNGFADRGLTAWL